MDKEALKSYFRYTKISTGIKGLDELLYGGIVIPEDENLLIVIRGADNTEKTMLSLQLLDNIAYSLSSFDEKIKIPYYSNYLKIEYLEDLFLDYKISSSIRKMTEVYIQGGDIRKCGLTNFFFNRQHECTQINESSDIYPKKYIDEDPDKMLCNESLYYNNRTNALHLRSANIDVNTTNRNNLVYERVNEKLNDYLDEDLPPEVSAERCKLEDFLGVKYIPINIKYDKLLWEMTDSLIADENCLIGINLVNNDAILKDLIGELVDKLKSQYKLAVLVIRDDVEIPMEKVDMIINLSVDKYEGYEYQIKNLMFYKSRYQTTALGTHQYKQRDYGIEVYPSLHMSCQQRRYLQRAFVYTHSNVITETFQQYLDRHDNGVNKSYNDYISSLPLQQKGFLNALSPSAYKNFSISKILDYIFISPFTPKIIEGERTASKVSYIENNFLYGNNGRVTAVIGEPNTYKRYITYGSAFSSAYKQEHSLFLLLNHDDQIVRRRLQCPARKNKRCVEDCKLCYEYLHFMDIVMGCISPAELIYYIKQQINISYVDNKKIKRIIIDDLQTMEYCFPLLLQDELFLPALFEMCRNEGIVLYIMCDRHSKLTNVLKVLADNVVCTCRNKKGKLELYVERYSGYDSKPSKIYAGVVDSYLNLFECYETGSRENRKTVFGINPDSIEIKDIYSMDDYWRD